MRILLYSFPPVPPVWNWFQDFLIALVREAISARIDQRDPRAWGDIVPSDRRVALKRRYGLRRRYESLCESTAGLGAEYMESLREYLDLDDYFDRVLGGEFSLPTSRSASNFASDLAALFTFGFGLLAELEHSSEAGISVRDQLYRRAYDFMPGHFCPFCGIDRFDPPHPRFPRHALDHYLPISRYPLFGAHLANLVPMCDRCNSSFKMDEDILRDHGEPRLCVNPHEGPTARISLLGSEPFGAGGSISIPNWSIEFVPSRPEFETWDSVFRIRLRYTESVLNAEYEAWLEQFAAWAVDARIQIVSNIDARDALGRWAQLCPELEDRGFLKRPAFEMLAAAAMRPDATGRRVTDLVRSLCEINALSECSPS
ncbi:HNH endonuclease [Microbacterium sp. Mcb102]|uniref:HNH endonuclease n=1 Tax=Microbacterium sp. Mcb102 TaxID=2926012 RepID=UPI0021C8A81A|nr:hypothetical protein [Microbacterium sp. Mcb102]